MGEVLRMESGGGALPRGHVLSYVTTTGSPTQVRAVAAAGVRAMGFVQFALGAWMGYWLALGVLGTYRMYKRYGIIEIWWNYAGLRRILPKGFAGLFYVLQEWDNRGWGMVVMMVSFVGCGLVLVALGGAVKRGNKGACVVCRYALVPMGVLTVFVTAVLAGQGICYGFGLGLWGIPEPMQFLWLLTLPPLVVGILLVGDLMRFLQWIGKDPMAEKPATPFLPS